MSLEEILDTARYYYSMGKNRRQLLYFPDFTASTTEQEESAMIDKAISAVMLNNAAPVNANVRGLCKMAQHIFFSAYREGFAKTCDG